MNVKQIVEEYLEDHGYDGLFSDHYECGCDLSDLMPCSESVENCEAGYKVICKGCDLSDREHWHIAENKK